MLCQVAYKEVLSSAITETGSIEDTFGDSNRVQSCILTLEISPAPSAGVFKRVCSYFSYEAILLKVVVDVDPASPYPIRQEWVKAVNEGVLNALQNGPILGAPVQDVSVALKALTASGGKINPALCKFHLILKSDSLSVCMCAQMCECRSPEV